jgi:hypothetical protein
MTCPILIAVSDWNRRVSGLHVSLYLDPESRSVEDWAHVGPGYPEAAGQGLTLNLGDLPVDTHAESLAEWLEADEQQEALKEMADAFRCSEVTSQGNRRGVWNPDVDMDALVQAFTESLQSAGIARYWDADDWFDGVPDAQVAEECETAGGLYAYVEELVSQAQGEGTYLDADDVETTVRAALTRAVEE